MCKEVRIIPFSHERWQGLDMNNLILGESDFHKTYHPWKYMSQFIVKSKYGQLISKILTI